MDNKKLNSLYIYIIFVFESVFHFVNVTITFQNCQLEAGESLESQLNPALTPPPLIPISMLSTQNSTTKNQTGLLPKLQLIPKSETRRSSDTINNKNICLERSSDTNERNYSSWPTKSENIVFDNNEAALKPAQNIAMLNGKRYIVVPKNNIMAVQPAITTKQLKIGEKPPQIINECSLSNNHAIGNVFNHSPVNKENSTEDIRENDNRLENSTEKTENNLNEFVCTSNEIEALSVFPLAVKNLFSSSNTKLVEVDTEASTLLDNNTIIDPSLVNKIHIPINKETLKLRIPPENKR